MPIQIIYVLTYTRFKLNDNMRAVDAQSKYHDRHGGRFHLRISHNTLQIIMNATAHTNRAVFVFLTYTSSSFFIIVMYCLFWMEFQT